ncbi:MAG TPA: hypothetical protein GX391_07125 [Firmicutes bacterium]|jgi:hypothetical protein|nr:hypothetical protein [Bacillota bacterium]HOQ23127.1 hypothetical protein [Bacillota bacterium]HPT67024.1 hypothetical protein [Bacillota bacterium]
MSACSVLRSIERVSQLVADFLGAPNTLTPAQAANLSREIELVRGSVRNLPLATAPKNDILRRLNQAQFLLANPTLSRVDTLLAVLNILSLAALKVKNRRLPCPPGLVIVHPSNRFSTVCRSCF